MARIFGILLLVGGLLIALPGAASLAQEKSSGGVMNSVAGVGKSGRRIFSKTDRVAQQALGKGGSGINSRQIASGSVRQGSAYSNPTGRDKWGRIDKRYTGQRCEAIENGVRVQRGC